MNERRDFAVIMLGRGLQAVALFAAIRLMTHVLSTEEVGRYYILLSLTSFFALFLVGPMGSYVTRKTHDWHRSGTMKRNLYLYWFYLLGVAAFAFLVLLLVKSLVGVGIKVAWFWLMVVVAGSLLFNSANLMVTGTLNLLGSRIAFVVFTLLTLWVGVGLSVFFVHNLSAQAEYWLAGLILSQFVIFLPAYRFLTRKRLNRPRSEPKPSSLVIPELSTLLSPIQFAWPLAIVAGLGWVQIQSYRFVISHFGGLESLGLFAVGFGIATAIMTAFYGIFSLYYYPLFYKEISTADSEGKRLSWNKFAGYLFPAAIVMAAFTIACAPYLARLMVATEFLDCDRFVLWGALSQLAFVIGIGFQMIAHAKMKTTWLIRPGLTGAVIALGGVLGLAQWDPQLGTGIALAIAGFAMVVHLAMRLHKEMAFSLPWRRMLISLAFSAPLLIALVGINLRTGQPTYAQSIGILVIAGSYLMAVQYLMATRWLDSVTIR